MDNQSDSVWIEPLEAIALSTDEEAEAQTPVSSKGDMTGLDQELISHAIPAGGNAGAPSRGGNRGGVVRLPPPELLRPHCLTVVCPQNM